MVEDEWKVNWHDPQTGLGWRGMVFNATFNNIPVISWWSVLLLEETGENNWPDTSHWQTLSHNVVSSTPHQSPSAGFKLTTLVALNEEGYKHKYICFKRMHTTDICFYNSLQLDIFLAVSCSVVIRIKIYYLYFSTQLINI